MPPVAAPPTPLRLPADELLGSLAADGELVHVAHLPARPARHGDPARPLAPGLAERLPGGGRLWSHQAAAVDALRSGRSVVVATPTASGKSLCYQVPIAEAVAGGRATALMLYPTKALAHDQLRALGQLALPGVVPAAYDGDSDPDERAWVRRNANVVLTNPDMLHCGILPSHGRWAPFLGRLRYVVVDELHVLRGVFGSHVAHVLRRLRRLCAHYGSSPTFAFGSATIGEPEQLASALCGLPVEAVTDDGSPRGERMVALWNPPVTDAGAGRRRSAHHDAAGLTAALVRAERRSITFTQSRKTVETVARSVRRALPPELAGAVRPYRGGYLAEERRAIEAELFGGQLRGVIATSALELGIDVGTLDACVLDGFPGTIAAFWQRAGRAGRSTGDAVVVLVAGTDQLDQWLMAHPHELLERPPEPAVVNPSNPFVLHPHLACAAHELPLEPGADAGLWGDDLDEGVRALVQADALVVRNGRAVWAGRGSPARSVGLRTGSGTEIRIVDPDARMVGTVDRSRAFTLVHPGAVYLHQGDTWKVARLDLDDSAAWVEPHDDGETTQARTEIDVSVVAVDRRETLGPATLCLGRVQVVEQVVGYQRKDPASGEVLEEVALDLPPTTLDTRAFWLEIPAAAMDGAGVGRRQVPGALHAAEHCAIGVLPLFTICDRWDVGGVSIPPLDGMARVFVYDGYPGGAGIAELGFGAGRRVLATALEVIESCPCDDGCPSCVQSPKCGNGNDPLEKAAAAALLGALLAG